MTVEPAAPLPIPVPPIPPLPPGIPVSPLATWIVAASTSGVIEAVNFGFIDAGLAQHVVAIIGIVAPLVVMLADAVIRHGHQQVIASAVRASRP